MTGFAITGDISAITGDAVSPVIALFRYAPLETHPLTSNRVTREEYLRYLSNTPPSEERGNRDVNAGEAAKSGPRQLPGGGEQKPAGNVEPGEANPGRAAAGRGGGNRGPENPAAAGLPDAITANTFCDNRGHVLPQRQTFLPGDARLPLWRFSDTPLREPPLTSNRVTRGEYLRYLSNTPPSEERDNRDANAGEAARSGPRAAPRGPGHAGVVNPGPPR